MTAMFYYRNEVGVWPLLAAEHKSSCAHTYIDYDAII